MASAPIFRSLLKHWRASRGMSQLDLAATAGVSARHISFLETGRSRPSAEMILKLGASLGLGLRDQNTLLDAAGFPPAFAGTGDGQSYPVEVETALARMLAQQEPYPLTVMNRRYDVVRMNGAARQIFARFRARPESPTTLSNTLHDVLAWARSWPCEEVWKARKR